MRKAGWRTRSENEEIRDERKTKWKTNRKTEEHSVGCCAEFELEARLWLLWVFSES